MWSVRENLFHSSLLASGGLLAIFGVPWHEDALPQSLASSSHGVVLVCFCVCIQISPFYKDTVILD